MNDEKRILVVDDDDMVVWIIEQALQRQGYRVSSAFDGEDGLKQARKLRPDLIILDIMMPIMDGYEVCEALKADPETATIPVLILSAVVNTPAGGGRGTVRERLQGLDLGAEDFVSKPIKVRELLQRVERLFAPTPGVLHGRNGTTGRGNLPEDTTQ